MPRDGDHGQGISADQRRAIRKAFASLPERFEDRFTVLRALRQEFQRELASAFEPLFREQVAIQPQAEFNDRLLLASAMSQHLDALGLSLLGPHGRPAPLFVEVSDPNLPSWGEYKFDLRDEAGRELPTDSMKQLPDLHVADAHEGRPIRFHWPVESPRGRGR